MNPQLTFIHALSPLHAGTGQGAGVIDLPIAREKATNLPFLPGSSLKGTLRANCPSDMRTKFFGPDSLDLSSNDNQASVVQFSDQRLLLLPVRSLVGTFAWVTSPYVLHRLARDIADAHITSLNTSVPAIAKAEQCAVVKGQTKIAFGTPAKVYLEDLDIEVQSALDIATWATWLGQHIFPQDTVWQTMLSERLCVVHDDVFNFVARTATEINARIKLREDAKTVQEGGLWYEETLPTETILSGIALFHPTSKAKESTKDIEQEAHKTILDITKNILQLGGKATVGHGLCRMQLTQEGM